MNSKIALTMIAKGDGDEPKNLHRALQSVAPFVDGIFITLTGPKETLEEIEAVCKEFNAVVSYTRALWKVDKEMVNWMKEFTGYDSHVKVDDELFLFDEARNYNLSQVPKEYDWFLWMDCDDVFRRGENLRKVASMGMEKGFEAIYFNYLYQVDLEPEKGIPPEKQKIRNVVIEHLRERLVRNQGKYKWIAPIHETCIEQVPTNKTDNYDCDILHLSSIPDRMNSLTRNLKNLELAVYQSKGKDPRHLYYLAKALFDMRTTEYDDRALPLIHTYLWGEDKSGWPEERAQACLYLAEIYRRKNELNNAIKACVNAMIESPQDPMIFVNTAITYAVRKEWERALFWVRIASSIPEANTTLVKNPRDLQGMILEVIYNCSLHLGHIDEAWAASQKMRELLPEDEQTKNIFEFITQLREQRDVTKIVVRLADYLKATGEWHKVRPLLEATPFIAEQTPFIVDLKQKNNPPKYWDKNEIAIYCGPGFTQWSPKAMENPGERFVGGSEEAVICMSRELRKLEWNVTVYGDPGPDEGDHNGTHWFPYYKFNQLDHFNVLVVWRQPGFFERDLHFKKGYVWMHDIANPFDFSEKVIKNVTKFLFLSQWHWQNDKRLTDRLPEEKVMFTSNGL
mgnify:CR=1 FL=1